MKQQLAAALEKTLENLNRTWNVEELPAAEVEIPRDAAMGDLATTVAMRLTKILRKPPKDIAALIISEITSIEPDLFETAEIAGPGFINFRFKRSYLLNRLERLLTDGSSALPDLGKGQKIQVEFVSANPTGPLHIGHGRGAAVGNALCNILQAAGYDVQREFYINDAGLQVRLLGESVYTRYQQLLGNDIAFPENGYKGEYIETVATGLRDAEGEKYNNIPFDECADFIIQYSYKLMLTNLAKDLKDFGVIFDRWQSEKTLHDKGMVKKAIDTLREKKLIYEKDGATWFSSTSFEDDKDRVVIKNDGQFTYFASDICYHKDKLDRGFETVIDIWGADHHGYIPRVRSVLEAFDLPKDKFKVVLIQMVSLLRDGEPVQMSKRAGAFITLREVMDEVGADITKFIFLTRRSDSQLDFDINIAKEQSSENPVFYVQYAFARISSLFRQAVERKVEGINGQEITGAALEKLEQEEEFTLIKRLLQYPMTFEGAARDCEPHRITFYLQELASAFHAYYYKHKIVTEDIPLTLARLSLCRAVLIVLQEGLNMIGVSAPERM